MVKTVPVELRMVVLMRKPLPRGDPIRNVVWALLQVQLFLLWGLPKLGHAQESRADLPAETVRLIILKTVCAELRMVVLMRRLIPHGDPIRNVVWALPQARLFLL